MTWKGLILVSVLYGSVAIGQSRRDCCNSQGWGANGEYTRVYNKNSELVISGEISSTIYKSPSKGTAPGFYLNLKDGSKVYQVSLGPQWFLDRQDLVLLRGDRITVIGSDVLIGDQSVIIAKTVIREEMQLVLRRSNGKPVWVGWQEKTKGRVW